MNLVQNFKLSNSLKALAGMVALGAVMLFSGVQNSVAIWIMSTIVIVVLAKAADKFSTKQEATAQEASVVSLDDYRASKTETEVAA